MLHVPYLLNRVIGPFFTGVLMAVVTSTSDPVSVGVLLTIVAVLGFISLPVSERLIERVRDAML